MLYSEPNDTAIDRPKISTPFESPSVLLLIVLLPLLLGTLTTGWLGLSSRRGAAIAAGGVTALSFALLLGCALPLQPGAELLQTVPWVPAMGLNVALRLDGLALLFAGLILLMGLLVVVYAYFYLDAQDNAAKFFSTLMLFMAAMLGVVLSDNVLLLAVFWELTSVSSFLLVGFWGHVPQARSGARQALAVTAGGGLALLAGLLLLGQIAGTLEISQMYARVAQIQADARFLPALLLILLGAWTKSAQVPFHFWLPDAMAAPTPVSAYLHSATMVKAGVYLLMRLYPVLSGTGYFEGLVSSVGLVTLVFAAWIAIFKHDIKGLLAYSTISHLGLIMLLIGLGTPLACVAALCHVLNHAMFKAALFMLAGVVDHGAHGRDLRRLGGLWGWMPWTATLCMVAAAAMAGVPLTNGFVSKEMFFAQTLLQPAWAPGWWAWLLPIAATLAAVFGVVYALRLVHGIFFTPPAAPVPPSQRMPHDPVWGMLASPALLVLLCLVVGWFPAFTLGPLVQHAALALTREALPDYHLALWHGWGMPLCMGVLALLGGWAGYRWLAQGRRVDRLESEAWFGRWTGQRVWTAAMDGLLAVAGRLTHRLENGSLQRYLLYFWVAAWLLGAAPLLGSGLSTGNRATLPATPLALAVWLVLLLSCGALLRWQRRRFRAVVLVGVVGLVVALVFVAFSAPDLALTQLAVEVVSTVLLLMGLALLPPHSPQESSALRRGRDAVLAVLVGAGVGWVAWAVMTREYDSIAWYFLDKALPQGGGANIVNVILVDFRGYDTFGEITVLGISGIGVFALMQGMRTRRSGTDARAQRWTFAATPLLLRLGSAVVLPLALVFSLYIFMRGHNAPGGGFVAGLITAVALVLQYMVWGQAHAEVLLRARGGLRFVRWTAVGLGLAGLTGMGAWLFGRPFMTSAFGHPLLPLLGELPLASAALFDLGVYATVVGSTLLTLSTLTGASREVAAPDTTGALGGKLAAKLGDKAW